LELSFSKNKYITELIAIINNMVKQRDQSVHFVGKILNKNEIESDESFAFTDIDKQNLDLKDLPIRLEHQDDLTAGKIMFNWTDPATKETWVMGRLDDSSVTGTFAKHAVQSSATGSPYYSGLSLQHKYSKFADGTSKKEGVEVSLVTDPRRPNCNIIWTSNEPKQSQTINGQYIPVSELLQKASKMSTGVEEAKIIPDAPATTVTETPTEPAAAAASAPATPQLTEEVYNQFKALKDQLEEQTKKNAELEKWKNIREEEQKLKADKLKKEQMEKNKDLMKTFLEHMGDFVDGSPNEFQSSIQPFLEEHPNKMQPLMEILQRASKKHAQQKLDIQKREADLRDKQLEMKFRSLIESTPAAAPAAPAAAAPAAVVEQTTQRASKRRKTNAYMPTEVIRPNRPSNRPNPITKEFVEAYDSVCGSASAMEAMTWLQNQKEARFNQGRRY